MRPSDVPLTRRPTIPKNKCDSQVNYFRCPMVCPAMRIQVRRDAHVADLLTKDSHCSDSHSDDRSHNINLDGKECTMEALLSLTRRIALPQRGARSKRNVCGTELQSKQGESRAFHPCRNQSLVPLKVFISPLLTYIKTSNGRHMGKLAKSNGGLSALFPSKPTILPGMWKVAQRMAQRASCCCPTFATTSISARFSKSSTRSPRVVMRRCPSSRRFAYGLTWEAKCKSARRLLPPPSCLQRGSSGIWRSKDMRFSKNFAILCDL
jgi:hypothetical protein